ncbi:HD domain-containing protein [Azotosporobacter soli]|uniref:HD domain-containing protein n=1 Tax=Azotosporobacter soli TaxID=3055040 RepID=UPI0031FE769B
MKTAEVAEEDEFSNEMFELAQGGLLMNKEAIVEETKKFVKAKMDGEGSGHDWWHIVRVYNNALEIARHEKDADRFIVELGALLHDIADHKFGYTDADRERIIGEFLAPLAVEQTVIDQVTYIANFISFKGGKNTHVMQTPEGKIVQDADRLDAMGAIGIGRAFTYGGHVQRLMYNPKEAAEQTEGEDTIAHFYEKLLLLKDRMNTETGKRKAQARHETMKYFLACFFREWQGE